MFSSSCSESVASDSESVGSSANPSVSLSTSTGAAVSASIPAAATEVGAGGFLVLLLVTGGFGGVTFFDAVAATAVGGVGLGLTTLVGLPTCAFRGTFACGGVTVGDPEGIAVAWAGVAIGAIPPVCTCCGLTWTFNCCLAFFSLAFAISCFLSDRINLLMNSFKRGPPYGCFCFQCVMQSTQSFGRLGVLGRTVSRKMSHLSTPPTNIWIIHPW